MKTNQPDALKILYRRTVAKKFIVLIAIFATLLSFCSCVKSEAVKTVETQITTLSESSSYKEINDVYILYKELDFDEKEKVENSNVLAKYISLETGGFVLNDEMISAIIDYFDSDTYNIMTFSKLNLEITAKQYGTAYGADWNNAEEFSFESEEKTDDYTYTKFGKVKISTKYGNTEVHNFELNAIVLYDEENNSYKVSTSAEIFN